MTAREYHRQTGEHDELMRKAAEDGLLACPPDIKEVKHVSGFALILRLCEYRLPELNS
jgi:hypothetical protein